MAEIQGGATSTDTEIDVALVLETLITSMQEMFTYSLEMASSLAKEQENRNGQITAILENQQKLVASISLLADKIGG